MIIVQIAKCIFPNPILKVSPLLPFKISAHQFILFLCSLVFIALIVVAGKIRDEALQPFISLLLCLKTSDSIRDPWVTDSDSHTLTARRWYAKHVSKHTSQCFSIILFYSFSYETNQFFQCRWSVKCLLSWILTVHSVNVDLKENIIELGT